MKRKFSPGDYVFLVSKRGYLKQKANVTLKEGQELKLDIDFAPLKTSPYYIYGHAAFWSGVALCAFGGVATWQVYETNSPETNIAWSTVAVLGYSFGAAAVISGVVLWILDPGDEAWTERNLQAGIYHNGEDTGLALSGRW